MKFYISKETEQELIALIAELTKLEYEGTTPNYYEGRKHECKEILANSIVLPVYKSIGEAMQTRDLDNSDGLIIERQ